MSMRTWFRRVDWSAGAELAVLGAVLAIAAVISYTHLRAVWVAAGAPWEAYGPLLVDGLFASAWLRMRRRRRQGEPVGWLAWAALGLALAATLAGNLAAAWISGHRDPLSLIVAAWPALAFALVWELVTGHGRATPALLQPAPAEVADADEPEETPKEKAERLIRRGYGRQRLAKEIGVSEHQARDLIDEHRQRQAAATEVPEMAGVS